MPVSFRSGGTSLSGQASTEALLLDTRRNFRAIEILDDGQRVRVQPGATVRQVNARLAWHKRRLGPDRLRYPRRDRRSRPAQLHRLRVGQPHLRARYGSGHWQALPAHP